MSQTVDKKPYKFINDDILMPKPENLLLKLSVTDPLIYDISKLLNIKEEDILLLRLTPENITNHKRYLKGDKVKINLEGKLSKKDKLSDFGYYSQNLKNAILSNEKNKAELLELSDEDLVLLDEDIQINLPNGFYSEKKQNHREYDSSNMNEHEQEKYVEREQKDSDTGNVQYHIKNVNLENESPEVKSGIFVNKFKIEVEDESKKNEDYRDSKIIKEALENPKNSKKKSQCSNIKLCSIF